MPSSLVTGVVTRQLVRPGNGTHDHPDIPKRTQDVVHRACVVVVVDQHAATMGIHLDLVDARRLLELLAHAVQKFRVSVRVMDAQSDAARRVACDVGMRLPRGTPAARSRRRSSRSSTGGVGRGGGHEISSRVEHSASPV